MSNKKYEQKQQQLFLKLRIDNVLFYEPRSYLITIFLKSYGMKLKTNVSDVVSQPSFTENTFYIPLNGRFLQADDLLTFEAYVVDENVHILLGRGVINPAQFLYEPQGSSKYLKLTSFEKRKEIIVGQLQLTLQYNTIQDMDDIRLNESQQEQNYLNQLMTRSFLEDVENPLYEKQQLDKVIYEKDIDLIESQNYKEKWRLYSQTLFERQKSINDYKSALEKYHRILKAQHIIRVDLTKGNRLLKQLHSFNINRLRNEERMDLHLYIDNKLRQMNESEIFNQMKFKIRQIQEWQKINSELEDFILNGQLALIRENTNEGLKETIQLQDRIQNEIRNKDYYQQKIERQNNQIDKLSGIMQNTIEQYSNQEYLQSAYINLRGDVLTIQSNIRKILYGNEHPMQIQELHSFIELSKKLNRLNIQQQNYISSIKHNLSTNDLHQQFQTLQAELNGLQIKVNALEEQIKMNSKIFSNNIAKLKVEIEVKKSKMQTMSMSNITYNLPMNVYEDEI